MFTMNDVTNGNSRNAATESKRLAPLKDCRRATDLSKPLSPPKSEAKSSTPETTVPNAKVHIRTHIAQQSGASRSRHVAECPAGPQILSHLSVCCVHSTQLSAVSLQLYTNYYSQLGSRLRTYSSQYTAIGILRASNAVCVDEI